MPAIFWTAYAIKLGIFAAVLAASYGLARLFRRGTPLFRRSERHVDVIESAMLAPNAAIYVVRAGARYFLVGSGGTSTLAELEPGELQAKLRST